MNSNDLWPAAEKHPLMNGPQTKAETLVELMLDDALLADFGPGEIQDMLRRE